MPGNRRPRKRYVPRPVQLAAPVEAVIARAGLMPVSARATFVAGMRKALEGLRTATSRWPAWAELADALNVAESLCALRIARDHAGTILAGQRALADVHARQAAGGSWTLRAAELKALQDAVEIAEIQLEYCTQGEFVDAVAATQRRVAAARQGSASPRAIVCVAGAVGR